MYLKIALQEEEKQAKKDEEIVRTLQARILREEWARRETLEQLQVSIILICYGYCTKKLDLFVNL